MGEDRLSRDQLYVLGDALKMTIRCASSIAADLGLGEWDESDLESWLLDVNVERCPECEWWTSSENIIMDEDGEILGCYDCTEDPGEEEWPEPAV